MTQTTSLESSHPFALLRDLRVTPETLGLPLLKGSRTGSRSGAGSNDPSIRDALPGGFTFVLYPLQSFHRNDRFQRVEMRCYKPLLFSAVSIIYLSFGFRVFRFGYITKMAKRTVGIKKLHHRIKQRRAGSMP